MLLYVSLLSLFFSLLFFSYSRKLNKGNYYLAGFFLINSLYGFLFYSTFSGDSIELIAILHGHFMPFIYLMGPFALFYVRSIITGDYRLQKKDVVHFLPFIILFIGIIPYFFKSFDYKLNLAESIVQEKKNLLFNINFIVPQSVNLTLRPIILFSYYLFTFSMLNKHKIRIKEELIRDKDLKKKYLWLTLFLSTSLVISACIIFSSIYGIIIKDYNVFVNHMYFIVYVMFILYIVLNTSLFVFPEILYSNSHLLVKIPDVVEEVISNEEIPGDHVIEADSQKLQIFTPEYLLTIEQAIAAYIEAKPYVDKKFNVSIMAVGLNIPSHHLSYYFSNVLCLKFTDWRNRLRVQYASELLKEGLLETLTLHVIASKSGFSNQTTFIEEFKRIYGSTPSNYMKSVNVM